MTQIHRAFVDDVLDVGSLELDALITDFKESGVLDDREYMRQIVADEAGTGMGGISPTGGLALYTIVRDREPVVLVETGVLNGWSTLVLLTAMQAVEYPSHAPPTLYSIDDPVYPDDDREDTGARLPEGREPGWIVPDEYRDRWEFNRGRSQRQLVRLLPPDGPSQIDVFVADGEHTHPAVLFELEVAYEWLADDGVIIVDDIGDHDAFDVFTETRDVTHGLVTDTIGYILKR